MEGITIRMDPHLLQELSRAATNEKVSRGKFVRQTLRGRLRRNDDEAPLLKALSRLENAVERQQDMVDTFFELYLLIAYRFFEQVLNSTQKPHRPFVEISINCRCGIQGRDQDQVERRGQWRVRVTWALVGEMASEARRQRSGGYAGSHRSPARSSAFQRRRPSIEPAPSHIFRGADGQAGTTRRGVVRRGGVWVILLRPSSRQ
jgi:hypothetical protein